MRKNILLTMCIALSGLSLIAQNVNIPDAIFKSKLLSNNAINTNGDTEISAVEANAYTGSINVSNPNFGSSGIIDLTGIEAFVNIRYLDCSMNLSISSLNVTQNTALTHLNCYGCQLSTIDLSKNLALTYLVTTGIINLNISANILLDTLINQMFLVGGGPMTSIDLSKNTNLKYLDLNNNQLSNLDISNNKGLRRLICNDNVLTSLDISNNTLLNFLNCSSNQITSLDVSQNKLLDSLICNNNKLQNLEVSAITNLKKLDCSSNPSLYTVCVKNETVANNNVNNIKDPWTIFSQSCSTVSAGIIQSVQINNVSANGLCDGSATVSVAGGTAPYLYKWSNGAATTHSISGKCAGTYTVFVSDALGLKDSSLIFIAEPIANCAGICPDTLTVFRAFQNAPFFQTISITIPDSITPPLGTFYIDSAVMRYVGDRPSWMSWETNCGVNKRCNFSPGTFCVVLEGVPAASGTYTVSIALDFHIASAPFGSGSAGTNYYRYIVDVLPFSSQATSLLSSYNSKNVSKLGLCDGSASVKVSNGTAPYSYQWSSGETTSAISGKCSNKYSVLITDFNGVKDSVTVYISEPTDTIKQIVIGFPIDTLITNYDTCIVDYNYPIDSAFITSFTMVDSSHLSVDYVIYQQGKKITFVANYEFNNAGNNLLVLQLNCKGTFTRMLKTTVITQGVNLQYNQIGITQMVPHSSSLSSGINEINALHIVKIYPNPFSSQTTLLLNRYVTNAVVKIIDITGKEVKNIKFSGTQLVIEKGDFDKGFYFIHLSENNSVLIKEKIIIQ